MKINKKVEFKVENPNSRITFETTGGDTWKVWDRFISLDNEKMYHIGNICDTCEFFFRKQSKSIEVNFNQKHLIGLLNNGEIDLTKETLDELSKIIPNGNYLVLKTTIKPNLVTKDSDNNYFENELRNTWRSINTELDEIRRTKLNDYYRESIIDFGKVNYFHKEAFFNFFVPLYNPIELNDGRITFYKSKLQSGQKPVALSIGVLDVKTSEDYPYINNEQVKPEFGTHWCLANYIIDGHHKFKAASELNQELELITFISRDESTNLIDDMVNILAENKKRTWQFWKK